MFLRSPFIVAVVFFVIIVCAACTTTDLRPRLVNTGDPVRDGWAGITNGPLEDRVLWQYRTALELIRRDQFATASGLLDEALAVVGGRFGKDATARKSRGYFSDEASKTFIGEPYERSMAFYYRGLIYWRDGELDNARACFRSAQIEDADSEGKEYAGDYVLLDYLDGLASFRLSGQGIDAYRRATNSATLVIPSRYEDVGNVLFFADYGNAPEKYAAGEFREQLKLRDGGSKAVELVIRSGNQAIHIGAMDDLSYQATTRGGRVMDHILANKAVFKRTTDAIGDAALVSGLILAQNRNTQEAGLGIAAFGVVSKLFSAATTPKADTRTWDNLPKFLAFGSITLPPGRHSVAVEFLNDQREIIQPLSQTIPVDVNAGSKDTVIIVSEH
ncbi:hypothetical protein N8494_00305 [bacterium]|jgi:hypothetical protein|nr:hypothetical protein [Verrucomicrobiota bacterium]MDA7497136.1 hypothetical protein [bacterium]MDA7632885.1 hypothetical protein [bacterium]MDA7645304.1 hypothetical protein [bacterium]MDA7657233.1 hypothetical protein [Verrucomicrobiota bacterium]